MALLDLGLGSFTLSRSQLLTPTQADRPLTHLCPLQGGSGSFLGATDADKAPLITLLSLFYDPSAEGADLRAQSLVKRTLGGLPRRRSGEGPPSGLSDLTDLAQLHARQPPPRRASSILQQQAGQGQANGEGGGEGEEQGEDGTGEGGDPLLMAFPRLWLGASVEGLRLTVGVARYHEVVTARRQESLSPTKHVQGKAIVEEETVELEEEEEEEEDGIVRLRMTGERRFKRRRTLLLEFVARGIESLCTFWAKAGEEDGGREGVTTGRLSVDRLETWDRQQNQQVRQTAMTPFSGRDPEGYLVQPCLTLLC
jgi:hypothetical protein